MSKVGAPREAFTCGIDAALRVIGGKWKPLVLYFLKDHPMRYGELQRAVRGVSHKVLIQHLKELEAHGIIARRDFGEIPPKVEYSLTPFGESLAKALGSLCQWGDENADRIAAVLKQSQ